MNGIRMLPQQEERVETGPTQFGLDWPGIFIRGDNCLAYVMALEYLLNHNEISDSYARMNLKGLLDLMTSSNLQKRLKQPAAAPAGMEEGTG